MPDKQKASVLRERSNTDKRICLVCGRLFSFSGGSSLSVTLFHRAFNLDIISLLSLALVYNLAKLSYWNNSFQRLVCTNRTIKMGFCKLAGVIFLAGLYISRVTYCTSICHYMKFYLFFSSFIITNVIIIIISSSSSSSSIIVVSNAI